ncbi:MAG: hypothetical protein AAGH70_11390 [Pseudomonadota bacterium]
MGLRIPGSEARDSAAWHDLLTSNIVELSWAAEASPANLKSTTENMLSAGISPTRQGITGPVYQATAEASPKTCGSWTDPARHHTQTCFKPAHDNLELRDKLHVAQASLYALNAAARAFFQLSLVMPN